MANLKQFIPPTAEQVADYARSLRYDGFEAAKFIDHWEMRGWLVRPGIRMVSWQAAVRTWRGNQLRWAAEEGRQAAAGAGPDPDPAVEDYAGQAFRIIRYEKGFGIGRFWTKVRDAVGPDGLRRVQMRLETLKQMAANGGRKVEAGQ